MSLPTLRTERLSLRALTLGDAAEVTRLVGVEEVARATGDIPWPFEQAFAEAWIGSIDHELSPTFGIEHQGRLVGAIGLKINAEHNRAELGYWLGLPHWGHGYATEAGLAILQHGFDTLGLHRIHADHLGRNPASGRVLAKLGMKHEGTLRGHLLRFGVYEDLACWGLLRDEWSESTR